MSDNLLDRAAARLRGHHIKGRLWDGHGGVCMNGALLAVVHGRERFDGALGFGLPEYDALQATLIGFNGGEYVSVSSWNDREETTEADALHAFEIASKTFEAEREDES